MVVTVIVDDSDAGVLYSNSVPGAIKPSALDLTFAVVHSVGDTLHNLTFNPSTSIPASCTYNFTGTKYLLVGETSFASTNLICLSYNL